MAEPWQRPGCRRELPHREEIGGPLRPDSRTHGRGTAPGFAGAAPGTAAPGAAAPGAGAAAPGAPAGPAPAPIAPITLDTAESICCDFCRETASRSFSSCEEIFTAGLFF